MPNIVSSFVEVAVFRFQGDRPEYLLLRRSSGEPVYPNLWQLVTGKVKAREKTVEAALRELREETGFAPSAFWVVPTVGAFFDYTTDSVSMIPAFACQVKPGMDPILSTEHSAFAWLPCRQASDRLVWPGQKRILETVHSSILGGEIAGILSRIEL